MITLTENACRELGRMLADRATTPAAGLRLSVKRGGCAGWQYEMQVTDAQPGDEVVEKDGARLIVAADSLGMLRGCEIDYSDDLTDSGFKVRNPNAVRACGCGTSFDPTGEMPAGDAAPHDDSCANPAS